MPEKSEKIKINDNISWFYFSDLIPHKIKPKSPR